MINYRILSEADLRKIGDGCYSKQIGELVLLLEETDTGFVVRVPCTSPDFGRENIIDRSLRDGVEKISGIYASFSDSTIKVISSQPINDKNADRLFNVVSVIERISQEYDLLPVCMRCKRVTDVKTVTKNSGAEILCGICRDEERLAEKHKEQIEHFRQMEKERIKKQKTAYRSLKDMVKPCLKIGLVTSAVGFVLMWLGLIFIPAFRLMVFVPGFLMGILTMSAIKKDNILHGAVKYLAVTGVSILIVLIITGITVFLSYRAVDSISTAGISNFSIPLFGNMAVYNVCFSIGGMLLGQAFTYFMVE